MGFWQKVVGVFGGGSDASSTPEEAFAKLYIQRALEHPRIERVEQLEGKPLELRVHSRDNGGSSLAFLANTFNETRDHSPEQKLAAIDRLLSIHDVVDKSLDWPEAQGLLVPQVRMAGFGGAAAAQAGLLKWPFAPFLHVLVGVDRGDNFTYVTQEDAERWAQDDLYVVVTSYAVLQSHVEADPLAESASYDDEAGYGIWHVTRDDSYESSRLALPGYLSKFRGKVPGNPIAIVPHRSLMVISGDGDGAAIARLAQMAEAEFNASSRSISPAIYTVAGDEGIKPLHLPTDHPQHIAVERGHQLLAATCYADQKAALDESFEASGRDIFVASLLLLSDKVTERVRSWASWKQGAETLLPEADLVALGADGREPFFVAWEKICELAAEWLELEPEHDPPRYRTLGFPTQAALERLAQHRAF